MHIFVCEFHNVFKKIKLQNYYFLEQLEALVSPGCMVDSSHLQVLLWALPFTFTFVRTLGGPPLIHTDFI